MYEYRNILKEVNDLCRSRTFPMSDSLVDEVKNVYKKGMSLDSEETPLMWASRWNFNNLVTGFIECAKQTQENLQTGEPLDLQEFLGYRNSSGETALHMVAKQGWRNNDYCYYVICILVNEVSLEHLISYRDQSGNTPLSLLERDSVHHERIFWVMEAAAAASKGDHQVDPATTDDTQQGKVNGDNKDLRWPGLCQNSENGACPYIYNGLISVYSKIIEMDPNSHPTSHINETRESLYKLNDGVLELTVENKSTILHLVSELGDTAYAKDILERHPSLIHNRNIKGETPFYVAARKGHIDILEILISYANSDEIEELATRKKDRNTALHIAIKERHVGVVFWLVKRIPQLANHVNDLHKSPIYLAVKERFHAIVELIVKECKEIVAYDGPKGKTALHAATKVPDRGRDSPLWKTLLRFNWDFLEVQDMKGKTPLHYAAKFGDPDMIQYLLKWITHFRGYITSAFEIRNTKGKNMLHIAIKYEKTSVVHQIFGDESLIKSLIKQRDSNGDTPLHLLMASNLEMTGIMMDGKFPFKVLNNQNCTPLDNAHSDKKETLKEAMDQLVSKRKAERRRLWEDLEKVAMERIKDGAKEKKKRVFDKIGDNVVLVVTLIATATFAAAFAVPGGFDGNEGPDQGMPILLRKAAYKAFVVANALAFSCSCTVLFGHIRLQLDEAGEEIKDGSINIISLQYLLTGIAMVAMAIAFITGTYVILTPSLGFAIPVCAMCLCIMVPLSIYPRKQLGFATEILRKLA